MEKSKVPPLFCGGEHAVMFEAVVLETGLTMAEISKLLSLAGEGWVLTAAL